MPKQGAMVPDIYRFRFGEMEVTTVRDGAVLVETPHKIFGANMPPEEVRRLAAANFLPPERMEIGFTETLLNTGGELVPG